MKKAKAIAGLGQYALNTAQSRAIIGGATYSEVYENTDGSETTIFYEYTDVNGDGIWNIGEHRTRIMTIRMGPVVR